MDHQENHGEQCYPLFCVRKAVLIYLLETMPTLKGFCLGILNQPQDRISIDLDEFYAIYLKSPYSDMINVVCSLLEYIAVGEASLKLDGQPVLDRNDVTRVEAMIKIINSPPQLSKLCILTIRQVMHTSKGDFELLGLPYKLETIVSGRQLAEQLLRT